MLVALRKESVDRNPENPMISIDEIPVALRKESVDRNIGPLIFSVQPRKSLSARRAWIEIEITLQTVLLVSVSLSARRAWIEIVLPGFANKLKTRRSPQGERG